MTISMLKIRRPLGRLIFNMGIAIPGKTVFLIETAPRFLFCDEFEYHAFMPHPPGDNELTNINLLIPDNGSQRKCENDQFSR